METERKQLGKIGSESTTSPPLRVKVSLAQLSRTPAVSPTVTTRALGMFMDKAVQAERGMIVDKDVRLMYCTYAYIHMYMYAVTVHAIWSHDYLNFHHRHWMPTWL